MRILTPVKVAAVLAFLLSSCGGATDELAGGVGSNTNWLAPCSDGDSCGGGLTCLCGVCTTPCSNTECTGNTECVVPSHDACTTALQPACLALCASDASCVAILGDGFACVVGRCEAQPASGGLGTESDAPGATDPLPDPGSTNTEDSTMAPISQERLVPHDYLTNSPPPPECVQGLPPLLPGCDPDVLAYSGIDCDGDGVPDHRLWRCEVASAERPTDYSSSYDCGPDDPGLRYWVMRDADGDGFGDGDLYCAGPAIPQGYILSGSPMDCDEQNSAVHPGAPEVWGDGVDSDCSGEDGPNCEVLSSSPETYVRSIERPSKCLAGGADLFLSSVVHCGPACPALGSLNFFVGNAGTVEARGPLTVSWSDDTGAFGTITVSPDALAPGATTAPFAVPTNHSTRTEISIDFEDCDPANGTFVDENPGGNSICL